MGTGISKTVVAYLAQQHRTRDIVNVRRQCGTVWCI